MQRSNIMDINLNNAGKKGFSLSMFLVTIGIVYGDIGTSPLYVMKSIVAGNGGIGQVDEQRMTHGKQGERRVHQHHEHDHYCGECGRGRGIFCVSSL